jgi:murein DD-endopeptidase MepM/ murein hydrolase activator NlpD
LRSRIPKFKNATKIAKLPFKVVGNSITGKEFHVRAERIQNESGKFRTHYSVERTTAPLYKPYGLIHHALDFTRRFEGDFKKYSVTTRLNNLTPVTKGERLVVNSAKAVNETRKLATTGLTKVALVSETTGLAVAGHYYRKFSGRLNNEFDSVDTGKIVAKSVSALKSFNNVRRTVYTHNVKKSYFQQKTSALLTDKNRKNALKNDYKTSKQANKLKLKQRKSQLREIHRVYSSNSVTKPSNTINKTVKPNKPTLERVKQRKRIATKLNQPITDLKIKKKLLKNQKKIVRFTRREKLHYLTIPLSVKAIRSVTITHPTSFIVNKSSQYAHDNDFIHGISAIRNSTQTIKSAVKQNSFRRYSRIQKKNEARRQKIHKKENKLQARNSKLLKEKPKSKRKKQKKKKQQEKLQDKIKKALSKVKEVSIDFVKFIFKFFGVIAIPLFIFFAIFAILFLSLNSTVSNNTYVLGTYNCDDDTIAKCISRYTSKANDFNNNLIKVQNAYTWRVGLRNGFNININNYDDTPKKFIFGRSSEFNYDPVYDFDPYKFIAFMCAYNYDFSQSNDDIENWSYDNDLDDDVIDKLFDNEYEFKHRYYNSSAWVSLDKFKVYPSSNQFSCVDETGVTTVNGKKYGYVKFGQYNDSVPSQLQEFTSDGSIHFDLTTGEIKNKFDGYKKTGFYIQNVNKQFTLGSSTIEPFYYRYYDKQKREYFYGFEYKGQLYHKTQLVVDGRNFDYAVAKEDTKILNPELKKYQLIRYYQAEKYEYQCKLYTNVHRKMTFENTIKKLLKNKGHYEERLQFYNTLLGIGTNDNTYGYGNHQMIKNALNSNFNSLVQNGKIYNNYGYDVQSWGKIHCSLEYHNGIDIEANTNAPVKAMVSGTIKKIDTSDHTIKLVTDKELDYWYDDHNKVETTIYYTNIKATVHEGDTVKAGQVIGKVDNYKHCYDNIDNTNANKTYLHISVELDGGWFSSDYNVDPQFLIYRD